MRQYLGVIVTHFSYPDPTDHFNQDGKLSAQFEQTMMVTDTGVEVLTARKTFILLIHLITLYYPRIPYVKSKFMIFNAD